MTLPIRPPVHRVALPELIAILPVYNEEQAVTRVALEWLEVLDGLNIPYRLHLCNDGSTDGTAAALETLSHPSLEISHSRNRGHGPTILRAYRAAAGRSVWVFQTDSDGELPASAFPAFWQARESADMLMGVRSRPDACRTRRAVSASLRVLLLLFFGRGIRDPNCPFRLLRTEAFRPLFAELPEDSFAPNVLVSAYALRRRLRVLQIEVPTLPRIGGPGGLSGRKLWRGVLRSLRQTLAYRFRSRRSLIRP